MFSVRPPGRSSKFYILQKTPAIRSHYWLTTCYYPLIGTPKSYVAYDEWNECINASKPPRERTTNDPWYGISKQCRHGTMKRQNKSNINQSCTKRNMVQLPFGVPVCLVIFIICKGSLTKWVKVIGEVKPPNTHTHTHQVTYQLSHKWLSVVTLWWDTILWVFAWNRL